MQADADLLWALNLPARWAVHLRPGRRALRDGWRSPLPTVVLDRAYRAAAPEQLAQPER